MSEIPDNEERRAIGERLEGVAASLDEQLMTKQDWCTCPDPYYCEGKELL